MIQNSIDNGCIFTAGFINKYDELINKSINLLYEDADFLVENKLEVIKFL